MGSPVRHGLVKLEPTDDEGPRRSMRVVCNTPDVVAVKFSDGSTVTVRRCDWDEQP